MGDKVSGSHRYPFFATSHFYVARNTPANWAGFLLMSVFKEITLNTNDVKSMSAW
jgi:hypothetical protein